MIISRTVRFRAGALVLALSSAPFAMGDVVKKKTGEKFDGAIIAEDSLSVTIEVVQGKGIKSQERILKTEISEVIKSTPDQKEADELAKLLPAPDRLSDKGYSDVITGKLEPFLKKYPVSTRKAEIEAILKAYKEEMEKAKSGAVKLEGEWTTPEELAWNRYNFEARLKRLELQNFVKTRKFYDAYRSYLELEADKPASVEFPKAVALVKEALSSYSQELDVMTAELTLKKKEREDSLKTLTPDDRRRVDQAIKDEVAEFKLQNDADRKSKVVIIRPYAYDSKSIIDTQTQLKREITRIDKIDVVKLQEASEKFRAGLKDMHQKTYISAEKNFQAAETEFKKDPFVKEQLLAAKKAADEQKRANEEAGNATSAVPAPGDPKDPKKPGVPSKTAAGAPVAKPKPAPAPAAEEDTAPVVEEENNMPKYLAGGAGVLLLIGIIAKVLGKKKGEDE